MPPHPTPPKGTTPHSFRFRLLHNLDICLSRGKGERERELGCFSLSAISRPIKGRSVTFNFFLRNSTVVIYFFFPSKVEERPVRYE